MVASKVKRSLMMRILIETQYKENYGAHDWDGVGECPQYWKFKGGDEIIVEVDGFRFGDEFADKKGQMIVDSMRDKIEYRSDYAEEYIIGWSFVEDDFQTQFEKDQLEFDGDIQFPAKRINYDDFMKETV
jgi:hypothetical protein